MKWLITILLNSLQTWEGIRARSFLDQLETWTFQSLHPATYISSTKGFMEVFYIAEQKLPNQLHRDQISVVKVHNE